MKCPHCNKSIKGHADGTKDFRELNLAQMKASIANQAQNLEECRVIYQQALADSKKTP